MASHVKPSVIEVDCSVPIQVKEQKSIVISLCKQKKYLFQLKFPRSKLCQVMLLS